MAKKKRRGRGQTRTQAARTNAARFLDAHGIPYEVREFSPEIHSATEAAAAMGADPSTVYKTLVIKRTRGKPLLVMAAGDRTVDLPVLAASVGEKKLRLASYNEAEELTGLQVGGISALALLNKGFDVYIDQAAQELEQITISAGRRGVNLCLSVSDLVQVTGARWADAGG